MHDCHFSHDCVSYLMTGITELARKESYWSAYQGATQAELKSWLHSTVPQVTMPHCLHFLICKFGLVYSATFTDTSMSELTLRTLKKYWHATFKYFLLLLLWLLLSSLILISLVSEELCINLYIFKDYKGKRYIPKLQEQKNA